jgi:hypothetical protein
MAKALLCLFDNFTAISLLSMLARFWYSFPVQLLVLHVKKNQWLAPVLVDSVRLRGGGLRPHLRHSAQQQPHIRWPSWFTYLVCFIRSQLTKRDAQTPMPKSPSPTVRANPSAPQALGRARPDELAPMSVNFTFTHHQP